MRWLLATLLAVTLGLAGCSDDDACQGQTYEEDLGQKGEKSPVDAVEVWLGGHEGLPQPPDEGWVVVDDGSVDPAEVVLTNEDGDGWWVTASRTESGGWVVTQATDDAASCEGELSG